MKKKVNIQRDVESRNRISQQWSTESPTPVQEPVPAPEPTPKNEPKEKVETKTPDAPGNASPDKEKKGGRKAEGDS